MGEIVNRLRDAWGRLGAGQKIRLVVSLAAVFSVLYGISLYATRIRYGVLYSNLKVEDSGPVVAALKEKRIPYRLAASGSTIEVPVERVDELRMELAGEGLPRGGGVGFEMFDKPAFGMSDFVQNVNYRRALERELARTIQGIDSVESARVHLALPPQSVFADEKRDPSASVVVRLKPGRSLSSNQVSAVTHLVASGVEGLDPARVSLIDGNGRMLSDGNGTTVGDALSASQLDAKRSIETGIETTLVSILEPVVGTGRVRASATVELNLARVQRVEETYDPDGAVVRSEQKSKSKRAGSGGGGVPGTTSNLPGGAPVAAASGGGSEETQASTVNFEINKTVATIAEPIGSLKRQSLAVVVDNAVTETAGADGKPEKKSVSRTEEEMTKITDLVRAAAGVDEDRGDLLIVQNIPFDGGRGAAELEAERSDRWLFWIQIARYAALPLAVLLVIFLVIRPGLLALRGLGEPRESALGAPITVAELQARLGQEALTGAGSGLRKKLIEAAAQDPEAAALVVRGWLAKKQGE